MPWYMSVGVATALGHLLCVCAVPLSKRVCPLPGTTPMSGLLVMRNEVSLWLDHLSPSPAIFSLSTSAVFAAAVSL